MVGVWAGERLSGGDMGGGGGGGGGGKAMQVPGSPKVWVGLSCAHPEPTIVGVYCGSWLHPEPTIVGVYCGSCWLYPVPTMVGVRVDNCVPPPPIMVPMAGCPLAMAIGEQPKLGDCVPGEPELSSGEGKDRAVER